jgi:hypothetical protein
MAARDRGCNGGDAGKRGEAGKGNGVGLHDSAMPPREAEAGGAISAKYGREQKGGAQDKRR